MRISSVRDLDGIQEVLMDRNATGPNPVYWMFNGISPDNTWINMTLLTAGRYGKEYPKTYGHYHGTPVPEIYHRVSGEGLLILQKKHYEQKMWVPEMVDEVLIISAKTGDEITITPEYGHSWSNVGELPLILYDNWQSGHQPSDYFMIQKLAGLAYYLVEDNGKVKAVPNPQYRELPKPQWLSAEEFKRR